MKKSLPLQKSFTAIALGAAIAVTSLLAPASQAGDVTITETEHVPSESALAAWWNGKYMTGNWFGVRDTLEDHGLKLGGKYYGAFFGVVSSQNGARGFWDQGIEFKGELTLGKLLKVDALNGVKAFAGVRWRDASASANPNEFVEASGMFNPSNWVSGMQWRLLNFGLEIGSEDNLPVEDMVVLRGGWLQPQKEFIDQPLSKLFLNNAVNSSKGDGGNIPFSSSATTWGGTLKVKPADDLYAKGGLFMSFPNMTATGNHGLAFQGFAPDTSQNGLWTMVETGWTPKLTEQELPGRYAVGGYYYGATEDSFNGTSHYGQYGFYFQFDQMLFREPSKVQPLPMGKDGKTVVTGAHYTETVDPKSGKSFKTPITPEKPRLNDQGLSMFNLVTFAPKYNNLYPFYFQSGLVYKGLIPSRDKDLTMFALAYGNYSYYNLLEDRQNGDSLSTYTIFLEWGYRVQLNKWAFFQPFLQYAIRPNGSGDVRNATILGVYTGVAF